MSNVLMPKATAVWLIEQTSLGFDQIADFCGLHPLEVQGIANEDVAKGIRGIDPIAGGFLSREEIDKAEADPSYRMAPLEQKRIDLPQMKKKGARYTPVARRGDRRERRQSRPEVVERVVRAARAVPAPFARPVLNDAVRETPRTPWLRAEKRVARPHLAAGGRRLEEERKRGAPQRGERGDGRGDVEKNLFRNGNEMSLACAGSKLFVGHEWNGATY